MFLVLKKKKIPPKKSKINKIATQLSHFTILQMFKYTAVLKKVFGERWKFWQLFWREQRLLGVSNVQKDCEINAFECFCPSNQ